MLEALVAESLPALFWSKLVNDTVSEPYLVRSYLNWTFPTKTLRRYTKGIYAESFASGARAERWPHTVVPNLSLVTNSYYFLGRSLPRSSSTELLPRPVQRLGSQNNHSTWPLLTLIRSFANLGMRLDLVTKSGPSLSLWPVDRCLVDVHTTTDWPAERHSEPA